MTRRQLLGLFGAVPLLRLWMPPTHPVRLQWEWHQGRGGFAEYFEVIIKDYDVGHKGSESIVIRVPGTARACEIPLPRSGHKEYHASVRAVNAQGSSELSNSIALVV